MIKKIYRCANCDAVFEGDRSEYFLWRRKQWGTKCLECGQELSVLEPEKIKLEFVGFWEKNSTNFIFYTTLVCLLVFVTVNLYPNEQVPNSLHMFHGGAWVALVLSHVWKELCERRAKKRQGMESQIVHETKIFEK